MILDEKFPGILDQGAGDLIVYEKVSPDEAYETSIDMQKELGKVVDQLYQKAKRLG